jgi:hypothetical protein
MEEGSDQVNAWKDVAARDAGAADHPAGEVKITKQLSSARVAILAGYVSVLGAVGAMTPYLPTTPGVCCDGADCF